MISKVGETDGAVVQQVTVTKGDVRLQVMTYGASITDMRVGDRSIVLGSDRFDDYLENMMYFGAVVGPVANRIADARFMLNGMQYQTDANEASGNTLHGGRLGTSQLNWTLADCGADFVRLSLQLADGHMGFPGNRAVEALYLVGERSVTLTIKARTDAPTPMALAPHCYFNLAGTSDISDHVLTVPADHYLPLTAAQVPTGVLDDVTGTRFDFRAGAPVGAAPIDHNLCLSQHSRSLREVARLRHAACPFEMAVLSTEAGLQVYDAGHLTDVGIRGRDGAIYRHRAGLALEPQAWPDAINHDHFASVVLRAGVTYHAQTEYQFLPV